MCVCVCLMLNQAPSPLPIQFSECHLRISGAADIRMNKPQGITLKYSWPGLFGNAFLSF